MTAHGSRPLESSDVAGERPHRRWGRPSLFHLVWLTIVWVLLWGEINLWWVLTGLAVAWVLTTFLPLPRAHLGGTFRPLAFVVLAATFVVDLVSSAIEVSGHVLRGRRPRGGVIRVQLRGHSDLFLATTAGMISLVPGTVVVDAHRMTGMLYLHVLDADAEGGLQAAHDAALRQEERILRAFATDAMLADAGYRPGWRTSAGRMDPRTGEVGR